MIKGSTSDLLGLNQLDDCCWLDVYVLRELSADVVLEVVFGCYVALLQDVVVLLTLIWTHLWVFCSRCCCQLVAQTEVCNVSAAVALVCS